jgi:hypothetical protein
MCNVDPTTYANDSKLEQAVIYAESNAASGAGTIGAVPTANSGVSATVTGVRDTLSGVHGGANI